MYIIMDYTPYYFFKAFLTLPFISSTGFHVHIEDMYIEFQNWQICFLGAMVHAATDRGHDIFAVMPSTEELESHVEILDDTDETQAQTPPPCQPRKRSTPPSNPPKKSKVPKVYTTRSSGKLRTHWSTQMNAKDPLGVLFGEDSGSASE